MFVSGLNPVRSNPTKFAGLKQTLRINDVLRFTNSDDFVNYKVTYTGADGDSRCFNVETPTWIQVLKLDAQGAEIKAPISGKGTPEHPFEVKLLKDEKFQLGGLSVQYKGGKKSGTSVWVDINGPREIKIFLVKI